MENRPLKKMAIGHFLDGKVSGVFGTHTHIPPSDLHLLENGTFCRQIWECAVTIIL